MQKLKLSFILFLAITISGNAQQAKKLNASEIYESIQKLNVLASVLYVAAHPDDENTRLISYMSNKVKARTAYLSLTRGDGGQNLIGPELRELLGIMRTQELLAARRVDGGEQRFTRANDFGYSKHPNETLEIWNKDEVLADVVWAIRQFKPDIIINRFDHRTPGKTHGHHTSSAMLSLEAFNLANDASKYKSQLEYTDTWQPQRIFFNTSWWFYGSQKKFEAADKSNMINFDVGVYYPLKGLSNNEVASIASSQHLCQGFGRLTTRGSQEEYIELLDGKPLNGSNNPFEGIDTSWNRVKDGKAIGNILNNIETNFNFKNPSTHLSDLVKAFKLLQNIENQHWKTIKSKELLTIIEACAGLYLEVSATQPTATKNETINLKIEALNRSNSDINLVSYNITSLDKAVLKNIMLNTNKRINFEEQITIPKTTNYTSAYWLNKKGNLGMYTVDQQTLIGKPETPRAITATFNLNIQNVLIPITKPVIYRYSKPDKGELYRPFEVVPPVSVKLKNKVYIFENDKEKRIEVAVKAGKNNIKGILKLDYPKNWSIFPAQQEVDIENKNDEQTYIFTVIPPKYQSEGVLNPKVILDQKSYTKERIEIDYNHIPFQTVYLPSQSKLVRLDIKKRGNNIGYIEGAGDVVPESLRQIGYNITLLNPEKITSENIADFDGIVVGIRAYNVLESLKFKQKHLLEYVKNGGNLIVQYNTNRRLKADNIAPYKLSLSRDRVTDENAKMTIIAPNHELLNFPNKITAKDFEGWVQERGLYFPNDWAKEFTPLFSVNDKGETEKKGSLLIAKYGKGNYIYTGLSFFREFPAGVSGAYRLFANMLSAGKQTITNPTIND